MTTVFNRRMDGQAAPSSRVICSEGGRYTAQMIGNLQWQHSSAPVWMLQTTDVCSVDAGMRHDVMACAVRASLRAIPSVVRVCKSERYAA